MAAGSARNMLIKSVIKIFDILKKTNEKTFTNCLCTSPLV